MTFSSLGCVFLALWMHEIDVVSDVSRPSLKSVGVAQFSVKDIR